MLLHADWVADRERHRDLQGDPRPDALPGETVVVATGQAGLVLCSVRELVELLGCRPDARCQRLDSTSKVRRGCPTGAHQRDRGLAEQSLGDRNRGRAVLGSDDRQDRRAGLAAADRRLPAAHRHVGRPLQ